MIEIYPFSLQYFMLKKMKSSPCNRKNLAEYCKISFPKVDENSFNSSITYLSNKNAIKLLKDSFEGEDGKYALTPVGAKELDKLFNIIKLESKEIMDSQKK